MGALIKRANEMAEGALSPIFTLLWRVFVAVLLVFWWAGKQYADKAIGESPAVVGVVGQATQLQLEVHQLQAQANDVKYILEKKAIDYDGFIKNQTDTNAKMGDFFKEAARRQIEDTAKLSAIGQQLSDQDKRLTRIELKLDQPPQPLK